MPGHVDAFDSQYEVEDDQSFVDYFTDYIFPVPLSLDLWMPHEEMFLAGLARPNSFGVSLVVR